MKAVIGSFLTLFFLSSLYTIGQTTTVKGKVTDKVTGEPIPGVHIITKSAGAITNLEGNYELQLSSTNDIDTIQYRYIGYETVFIHQIISEVVIINIQLVETQNTLDAVVVSANLYAVDIKKTSVSMEVLTPLQLENKNAPTLDEALEQVPGVTVQDGQVSIRGGSGFSYGAGSRVLVLVDDLPMISGDAGDVKWDFLPMENIKQVEVLKGASSVIHGSSALNGVINIRTAFPTGEPETKINFFQGVYDNPVRKDSTGKLIRPLKWWTGAPPSYTGLNLTHSNHLNGLKFIIGTQAYSEDGYRMGEKNDRFRINLKSKYTSKKKPGLSFGINNNFMWNDKALFLLWQDANSGALIPRGGIDTATSSLSFVKAFRASIDPYLTYWENENIRHDVQSRYFNTTNNSLSNQGATSHLFYNSYKYQCTFKENNTLIVGVANTNTIVISELYSDHKSFNTSWFTQYDKKWERLNLSIGARLERFQIDRESTKTDVNLPKSISLSKNGVVWKDTLFLIKDFNFKPVLRFGLNYQAADQTFLRFSYGQGYRFPSIAEKFVNTSIDILKIFPNPNLQPETGSNIELGIKQGFKFGKVKGLLDIAFFNTKYQNMVEFVFDQYYPDSVTNPTLFDYINYSGFQSQNFAQTQISGIETSVMGEIGKKEQAQLSFSAGYTYITPIIINPDSIYYTTLSDSASGILKYRSRHLIRSDFMLTHKKLQFGLNIRYNSFIENIDKSFEEPLIGTIQGTEILPGLKQYRDENDKGAMIFNFLLNYQINSSSKIGLMVKNLFNKEYMLRPGDIQPSRVFSIQFITGFIN